MATELAPFSLIPLHGAYDGERREELQAQLKGALEAPIALLDMRDVTCIDTGTLTELLQLKEHMPGEAIIRMIGLTPNVRHLLNATGLDSVFEIHDSLKTAAVRGAAL